MSLTSICKFFLALIFISFLSGCANKKIQDQAAIDAANTSYRGGTPSDAEAMGLGEEGSFQEENARTTLNKRNKRIYYFDFDSNIVHELDKPAILANAKYLTSHPNAKIMLEGHTDPRGSREYNIGLGERRAKAVAIMLKGQGVTNAQIRIVSYGAQKLAADGHSEEDYQKDRRVELVYMQR